MKRMLLVFMMVAIMVVLVVGSAMPALAQVGSTLGPIVTGLPAVGPILGPIVSTLP